MKIDFFLFVPHLLDLFNFPLFFHIIGLSLICFFLSARGVRESERERRERGEREERERERTERERTERERNSVTRPDLKPSLFLRTVCVPRSNLGRRKRGWGGVGEGREERK